MSWTHRCCRTGARAAGAAGAAGEARWSGQTLGVQHKLRAASPYRPWASEGINTTRVNKRRFWWSQGERMLVWGVPGSLWTALLFPVLPVRSAVPSPLSSSLSLRWQNVHLRSRRLPLWALAGRDRRVFSMQTPKARSSTWRSGGSGKQKRQKTTQLVAASSLWTEFEVSHL